MKLTIEKDVPAPKARERIQEYKDEVTFLKNMKAGQSVALREPDYPTAHARVIVQRAGKDGAKFVSRYDKDAKLLRVWRA